MFGRILGGFLLAVCGGALCYYSYQLVKIFGRSARMESNLGGTRNGIVIGGFLLMILGVLMMFGVFEVTNPADQVDGVGIGV